MATDRDIKTLLALLSAEGLPGDPTTWPPENRQAATGIMWNDLKFRLRSGTNADGAAVALRQLLATSAVPAKTAYSSPLPASTPTAATIEEPPLSSVDVLVICPLAKELYPALVPFGIDPTADEWRNIDGHKIYRCEVERGTRRNVVVAISVATKPRNVPMALVTQRLVSDLRPSILILCGIGGGVSTKTELGDVVVSTAIRDVEGGRAERKRTLKRDETFNVPTPTDRQLKYFVDAPKVIGRWRTEPFELIEMLRSQLNSTLPSSCEVAAAKLRLKDGIIVAGEKLVANGKLPEMLEDRDDRIRSCDMEGSGFAQAADGRQWAVFRGISDFGDPKKTDTWQAVAAANAALAVKMFLETEFRLRSEMAETSF